MPNYSSAVKASSQGEENAKLSLIFGIVGIFILGLVFGPLAIWQASKAEKLNTPATAGKVLGWIATVLSVISLIIFGSAIAGGLAGGFSTV